MGVEQTATESRVNLLSALLPALDKVKRDCSILQGALPAGLSKF